MELNIGEMLMIVLVIVVLFGPDKLPSIARDLGQGLRKMRGAMDDIKTEIMKETETPVSEIKKEIEKVKEAAQKYDPSQEINRALAEREQKAAAENPTTPEIPPAEDENYEGPVSR